MCKTSFFVTDLLTLYTVNFKSIFEVWFILWNRKIETIISGVFDNLASKIQLNFKYSTHRLIGPQIIKLIRN
jgi:hypothetical protein